MKEKIIHTNGSNFSKSQPMPSIDDWVIYKKNFSLKCQNLWSIINFIQNRIFTNQTRYQKGLKIEY